MAGQRPASGAGSTGASDFPDLDRLPFGRTLSPSASSTHSLSTLANGYPTRESLDGVVGGANDVRPGSLTGEAVNGNSSAAATRDAMMVELLSGAALIEAAQYKVLDWDSLQATKKVRLLAQISGSRADPGVQNFVRNTQLCLLDSSRSDVPSPLKPGCATLRPSSCGSPLPTAPTTRPRHL